jgi:hypothetical protein
MGGGEVGSEELPMATVTLSLVGTVVEDGVRCRWVESKTVIELPAELAGTVISKVLVSENDLLESEKPFAHVHRRWMRIRDEPVKQAPNEVSAASYERLVLWTPGMLKGSEPAKDEAKVIDYQRGQIKNAQARTGQLIYKQPAPDKKEMRFVSKYTVWQHSDVSFGFAEARIVSEQFHDNKKMGQTSVVYYRLQDMGTDAKSELPDSN